MVTRIEQMDADIRSTPNEPDAFVFMRRVDARALFVVAQVQHSCILGIRVSDQLRDEYNKASDWLNSVVV